MAKKPSTTPKGPPKGEEDPFFAGMAHGEEPEGDDGAQKTKEQAAGPDISAVLEQIDRLNRRIDGVVQTGLQYQAPVYQPAASAPASAAPPQVPQVDFSKLPDPYMDLDAYNRALQEQVTAVVKSQMTQNAPSPAPAQPETAAIPDDAAQELWGDFSEAYPQYANSQGLVQFAAQNVVNKAIRRKIDANRYVFGQTEMFFADVDKELKKMLGGVKLEEPAGEKGKGDDADDPDPDPSRTAGIFGGMESGGKPSGGKEGKEGPGDMIAELHALQRKDKYF